MLKNSRQRSRLVVEDLCLACGFCCNGAIFADVKLQRGDDARRLAELGLPLVKGGTRKTTGAGQSAWIGCRFLQPCVGFDGCRCVLYAHRPQYCRQFECALLQRVKAGATKSAEALRVIRQGHRRVEDVKRLLRECGDADEQLALGVRFRRTARRLERTALNQDAAAFYGRLTLAVHDLNCLLSEAFYPG
jgi:uncharacterized protein